ncbi:uncharacterized protein MELLADRAFT_77859 [Melampsora larici-populina 98AG31]|uniref:Uncharacterized protein n=1 Tax=Melampsora larici-populina (strain 98AG31 / pathotype 3-4-7) TaxID=747676 RepID=F4RMP5_MELLP|nr:uncharacterized protein MELLADRAFT_77859 [Melampsora larici-populina 98AG31]EGG06343.1 hypothetical protein MELLADRAFT_77859 [Melampsora larici-populina 98AG31]
MSTSTPNLSRSTSSFQLTQSTPTLPHQIVSAAHALSPLDDLHLAHLVHSIKPLAPSWSFQSSNYSNPSGPSIESNDRLRTDELADLPAPEAERLHAAYDIEDHLDSTPDRLLVFGPYASLSDILEEVKSVLRNKMKKLSNNSKALSNQKPSDPTNSTRYNRQVEVYVARLWFQPLEGPAGSYKWEKGGADLIRFEMAKEPAQDGKEIFNWSPVEVALSQALEIGHQLLALLHLRHFDEILSTMNQSSEFCAIDPIIWLVDPVEYAHAQLRETTEWGWSEHHVDYTPPSSSDGTSPSITKLTTSGPIHQLHRPLPRSRLSQEIGISDHHNPSTEAHYPTIPFQENLPLQPLNKSSPASPDNLPRWLDDLLDRRLPRILSLPDGCLSYDLLDQSYQTPTTVISNRCFPILQSRSPLKLESLLSPPLDSTPKQLLKSLSPPLQLNSSDLTPTSVRSTDLHYIPNPGPVKQDFVWDNGEWICKANPLKYYHCKVCAEHAFKIALSHRLNEEKGLRRPECPPSKSITTGIGLGLKGRAIKEAMDREDDEFLNLQIKGCIEDHQELINRNRSGSCCLKGNRLGWDEGEAVEDG